MILVFLETGPQKDFFSKLIKFLPISKGEHREMLSNTNDFADNIMIFRNTQYTQ